MLGAFQVSCFSYALAIYPLIGIALGHGYPVGPIFGLPCPTTIYTFGLLSASQEPSRGKMFLISLIPLTWAVIGTSAAKFFGVYQDFGLAVAALGLLVTILKIKKAPAYLPRLSPS